MKPAIQNPITTMNFADIAEQALRLAKQQGATACEVSADISQGYSLTVRQGEIDVLEHQQDKGVGVTVYFDQAKAHASTTDTRPESLAQTIDAACAIAKHTGSDPCNGLAPRDLLADDYPDLDLYFPADLSVDAAIDLAREAEAIGLAYDPKITNSDGFSVDTGRYYKLYANSNDFIGAQKSTHYSYSCSLLVQDAQGMERDYAYSSARDMNDLQAPDLVAKLAAERSIARLNPKSVKTQQVPVIFDARIAPGFLGHFLAAIRGGNLYRKASFLVDHKGKPVFPSWFTLQEAPHVAKGLASSAFDAEGVKTQDRAIVSQGVLQDYTLSCYSARQLGLTTTGNAGGNYNLFPSLSDYDLAGLLQQMHTGLLVTEVMGQGVNIVTGDYSRGASGFWVENGELQYPVAGITIAGNLKTLFQQLRHIGNDINQNSSIQTGSILLDNMTVAGS